MGEDLGKGRRTARSNGIGRFLGEIKTVDSTPEEEGGKGGRKKIAENDICIFKERLGTKHSGGRNQGKEGNDLLTNVKHLRSAKEWHFVFLEILLQGGRGMEKDPRVGEKRNESLIREKFCVEGVFYLRNRC